jgi:class 3 adenylate cyclase/tetratricopeptide (TPR) repeat protein
LPGEFPFCPFCAAPLTSGPSASVQEERKVVSVLFCDLVGFTASSDAADPEDVRARIRPYHARLREVIERFGGTVEKFVGDAVMAVFGAPVAHEDDAERAVRAGLRILEAIEELNAEDASLALQVRVGINTGEAVVALGAKPETGEGIVTGDVVNTASRLQGAAPVNGVAVSEQTIRATERVFDYEPLEPVSVKGKSKPLPVYRPLQARARLGSDVTRTHTTPLVGRDLERTLLVSLFERAVQQKSCQLVTLVGEPGVGKSRLCVELLQHVEARQGLTRWRQGRCLPYGEGIAVWALGEIVKAECGILETDSPEDASRKLASAVPESAQDRTWLLARLAPLVGAPSEPASQEESFAAWRSFLESLATEGPAVLVFEDLHWADPALLAFLEYLADWAQGVPLVVLCTARPELHEQHPTWGAGLRNATTINLAPLTDEETAQLVSGLLERAVLSAETQQQLLERAGGNPLYAEEFVRLIADRGELGGETAVPESVQALIAARLDTLSPGRKSLLQDASVLGKVFWAGALAQMGDRDPGDVERELHELARKELVRPSRTSSMEGESEYGFWHALVRDVAYGQIPRAGRVERHQQAAAWIEARAGERVEDLADVLAYHYEAALDLARVAGRAEQTVELESATVRYLALAGERALGLDTERAEQTLSRALALCPPGHPDRLRMLEQWAQAAEHQGRLHEAREALEQAVAGHRASGDRLAEGRSLTRLHTVLTRGGDPHAKELLLEAIRLLEAEPPGQDLVNAYARQAGFGVVSGAYEETIAVADKALALAVRLGLPEPAYALGMRGGARASLGEQGGVVEMRHALTLAIDRDEARTASLFYNNVAVYVTLYEGPQAALDLCREGIEFCRRRGLDLGVDVIASGVPTHLADLGQTDQAVSDSALQADRLEQAGDFAFTELRALQLRLLTEEGRHEQAPTSEPLLKAARESGNLEVLAFAIAGAAPLLRARGQSEEARLLLQELASNPASRTTPPYAGILPGLLRTALALDDQNLASSLADGVPPLTPGHRHAIASSHAQLAEARGSYEEAARLYADAANRWREFGNVPERAYALLGQGRCLRALGDPAADAPLAEARELFASMGYRPALEETEALLAESQTAASTS